MPANQLHAQAAPHSAQPQTHVIMQAQHHYQSPYPPPAVIDQIATSVPNGVDRLVCMVETLTAHEIDQAKKNQEAQISETRNGQWMGFLATISLGLMGLVSIYMGAHPTVTIAFLSAPVVSLVKSLISPRDKK